MLSNFFKKLVVGCAALSAGCDGLSMPPKPERTERFSDKSTEGASLYAIDSVPVSMDGVSFQDDSLAQRFHEFISNRIENKESVPLNSIKSLFIALSMEDCKGVPEGFFVEYAKKFASAELVKSMMISLIDSANGDLSLSRSALNPRSLAILRALGNSFPEGTSVEERRQFFELWRDADDLNLRALSLMLCVNSNIAPQANYQPSEIVRASQQLAYNNFVRGDEIILGIYFRDSIMREASDFPVDAETLDRIKMPLMHRAEISERRNPGITRALITHSEGAYVAFLGEHALRIESSRKALADTKFLSPGTEFFAVLHRAPQFHRQLPAEVTSRFGIKFDPRVHSIKGEPDIKSEASKQAYFDLLSRNPATSEVEPCPAVNLAVQRVVWFHLHGDANAICLTRGEEDSSIEEARLGPILPSELIKPGEDAANLFKAKAGVSQMWYLVTSCEGWNYSMKVNEKLISERTIDKSINMLIQTGTSIPGRVVASQKYMASQGGLIYRRDENGQQVEMTLPLLLSALGSYFDERPDLKNGAPSYTCTFRELFEIDAGLAKALEQELMLGLKLSQGQLLEEEHIKQTDPAIMNSQMIDIDQIILEILSDLRRRGFEIPEPSSDVQPERRNSDYVDEISSLNNPWFLVCLEGVCLRTAQEAVSKI